MPDIHSFHEDEELIVTKLCNCSDTISRNSIEQFEDFKKYLTNCKSICVSATNRKLEEDSSNPEAKIGEIGFCNNVREALEEIDIIISLCKNKDQEHWLRTVLSYLHVFYFPIPSNVPGNLKSKLYGKKQVLTNAPGGYGKSWLVMMVQTFFSKRIDPLSLPVFLNESVLD